MSTVLSLNCRIYRNAGSYGSPSWNEINKTKDLSLKLEKSEADVTDRSSNGWEQLVGTIKKAPVEFDFTRNTAIAATELDYDALLDSFINHTAIELYVADGAVGDAGTQGLRAAFEVMAFTRDEKIEDAVRYNVTAKLTPSDNPPAWYEIP